MIRAPSALQCRAMLDPARQLLRHTIATLAYRAAKILRDAPPEYPVFRAGQALRTPAEILAHMGDLFDWALSIAQGRQAWRDSQPLEWTAEVDRFFAALGAFDDFLASDQPLAASAEKLFQGPVADGLTHTGQLALLRRLAGQPIRGENYHRADIAVGQVTVVQPAPRREFD